MLQVCYGPDYKWCYYNRCLVVCDGKAEKLKLESETKESEEPDYGEEELEEGQEKDTGELEDKEEEEKTTDDVF